MDKLNKKGWKFVCQGCPIASHVLCILFEDTFVFIKVFIKVA